MKHRASSLFLVVSLASLTVICWPGREPATPADRMSEDLLRDGKQTPKMNEIFYRQRTYGNPVANIGERVWEAYERMDVADRMSIRKGAIASSVQWNEEGPWNIAGRIRGIAIHPTNPTIIYAAAASGGVWKTVNSGQEWFPVGDALSILPCGDVAIDRNNPERIFVGTGEPDPTTIGRVNATPIYSRGVGVFRSENGGTDWTLLAWPGAVSAGVHRIALHPVSADTFLVASTSDLWKTTNAGVSWTKVLTGIITDVMYKPNSPSTVYAVIADNNGGASNGVWVSEAGGSRFTWRKLAVNFPRSDSTGRMVLDIPLANPDRIFVAITINRSLLTMQTIDNDFLMLVASSNGGETWERKINAIPQSFTNGQAYYDLAIAVSPYDPNVVFLGGIDIWRSINGGGVFSRMSDGYRAHDDPRYAHVDQHTMAFSPNDGNTMWVGNDGGVHVTSSLGLSWTARLNKLGTIQYYGCTFDPSNLRYLYGGTQDNGTLGKVTSDNAKWFEISGGDGGNVAIDPAASTTRYVVTTPTSGGRSIIRIQGGVGTNLSAGLQPGVDRFNWIAPLMFHPKDRTRLYTATQFLYVMKNPHGSSPSWQAISPTLSKYPYYSSSIVTDIAISEKNPDWMYTVSGDGQVMLCKDLGGTDPQWTDVSGTLPNRWLTGISVDWDDPNTAYVAVNGFDTGHAFKTTDAGQTWTDISGDLPNVPAAEIIRSRQDANTLFIATDLGVWYTTNGGTNWSRYGTGLPNVVVFDMDITPDNVLIAATHGRGMWTASSILSGAGPAATTFALGQNYPNPFNPSTAINFSVAERGRVTLRVFDRDGRVVKTLCDETLDAGEHLRTLTADAMTSGTYFYTLETGGKRLARKMVLLK